MKIFVADAYGSHSKIEMITGNVGLFQEPISEKLFFEAKTLGSADAVLVPHDAYYFSKYPEYLKYLNTLAVNKLVIFSDRGDFPKRPKITNSIALRVAISPGESRVGKIVIPYNVESLAFLPFKKLATRPTVSFVGYMPKISLGRFKQALLQSPFHPIEGNGAIIRRLSNRTLIRADISYIGVVRDAYGAFDASNINPTRNRSEYLDSISQSDLVACPRGDANQSARFYETISAGRIPLIPDTSIVLPHVPANFLSGLFVNLPFRARKLEILIREYFESIGNQSEYNKRQKDLRDLFLKYLRFEPSVKRIFAADKADILNFANLV
jgi:hypothetical protein